jgi:TonB family protein
MKAQDRSLEELKKLGDLYKTGILSEEEFNSMKNKILGNTDKTIEISNPIEIVENSKSIESKEEKKTIDFEEEVKHSVQNEKKVEPVSQNVNFDSTNKNIHSQTVQTSSDNIEKKGNKKIWLYVLIFISLLGITIAILFNKNNTNDSIKSEIGPYGHSILKEKILQDSLARIGTNTENTTENDEINNSDVNEDDINKVYITIVSDKAYFYNESNINTKSNKFVLKDDVLEFIEDGTDFVKAIYKDINGITTEAWILKSDTKEYNTSSDIIIPNNSASNEVFSVVEEMPQFPGGATEMMSFIQRNIQYPQNAKEAGLSGRCYLQFIVNENGSITDITVLKGVPGCMECDNEAIRTVESMPNWKAGRQNGKNVRVQFNLPINFSLK